MNRSNLKQRLATALVGAACASALAAPGAFAHHGSQAAEPAYVPPPPSSIAASAGEAYSDLRSPETASAERDQYVDLRSPDARNQPAEYAATVVVPAAADAPSEATGFDGVSAAIGAIAAAAISLVLMATLGMRRPSRRGTASA
jgi:hypothetical protein